MQKFGLLSRKLSKIRDFKFGENEILRHLAVKNCSIFEIQGHKGHLLDLVLFLCAT